MQYTNDKWLELPIPNVQGSATFLDSASAIRIGNILLHAVETIVMLSACYHWPLR